MTLSLESVVTPYHWPRGELLNQLSVFLQLEPPVAW